LNPTNQESFTTIAQSNRKSSLTYDQYANVATSTDALGRKTSFQYDKANRVTRETLPDGSIIAMTYDLNGNMTSITPPGKTAHTFAYNLFELLQEYLPPSVGAGISGATTYTYNLDKQLTQVNRPDGTVINFNYGSSTGLLNTINTPTGSYSYVYPNNSDLVNTLTSPDNEVMTYQYAGNVPKRRSNELIEIFPSKEAERLVHNSYKIYLISEPGCASEENDFLAGEIRSIISVK
jgi:YD repeat-containing protein